MRFLLIDNHPLTLAGYVSMLQKYDPEAVFYQASTLSEVLEILNSEAVIDIVVMDCNIGGHKQAQMNNGIDWIRSIKLMHISAKILLVTAHKEVLSVYQIHKKVFPDGLLIKSDVSLQVLCEAIDAVLKGERFYSEEVHKQMAEMSKNSLMREHRNIEILMLLTQGYKAKEISEMLFLSEAAIHKRIALMKKNFRAPDSTGLVKIAVKKGFV